MPKDEFDFQDPFELNGVALLTHEDTTDAMAECFIGEFLRIGYNSNQVLALFRNPRYAGPNLAMEKRGEPFVRNLIEEVFARWGRPVAWIDSHGSPCERAQTPSARLGAPEERSRVIPTAVMEMNEDLTDPMGAPIPKPNL